jgi:hypothetical protein
VGVIHDIQFVKTNLLSGDPAHDYAMCFIITYDERLDVTRSKQGNG